MVSVRELIVQERTLVLLKPDCVERSLVGRVTDLLESKFDILAYRRVSVTEDRIFDHYRSLIDRLGEKGRRQLRDIYLGKEVVVMVAAGEDAIGRTRQLIGCGDPAKAAPDTIRGSLGIDSFERADREGRLVHNLIHASESADDAEREINIWFTEDTELRAAEPRPTHLRA